MKHIFLFYCILCACRPLYAQSVSDTIPFRIVSYNVENLFDCQHDSLKNDYEFLPHSIRRWTWTKYKRKLDAVARTIVAAGEHTLPALVALCEVENDTVLRDLTRRSALKEAKYRYVMTDSPDERGIDVALLYQRDRFKLLNYRSISLKYETRKREYRHTRDILHVSGLLLSLDTLDVFICHFPSKAGGSKEAENHRLYAARKLKEQSDSIYQQRKRPFIILTGDFNDTPHSRSIREELNVRMLPVDKQDIKPEQLYHLHTQEIKNNREHGSYKYQSEWILLDHIIVTGSTLNASSNFQAVKGEAGIFRAPFLLTEDKKYGGIKPFRTYYGMKYQQGYSDHLPVWAEFKVLF